MTKSPAPKVLKTIFQARYAAKLGFYDRLMAAAQKLEEFPHWQTNRLEVLLKDPDHRCSLVIGNQAFAYDQDSGDPELEKGRIGASVERLPEALGIESFVRLGLRRYYVAPVDMDFASLVAVVNVKLLSQDEALRRVMPSRVEDLMYRVDVADDEYSYHIMVGPVRRAEIPRLVGFDLENHLHPETRPSEMSKILASYPEVAVLFDVDLYRMGEIATAEATGFVESGRTRIDELVAGLGEYVLTTEVTR